MTERNEIKVFNYVCDMRRVNQLTSQDRLCTGFDFLQPAPSDFRFRLAREASKVTHTLNA